MNIDNTKKRAFEIVAEEIENTDKRQREGEAQIDDYDLDVKDAKELYNDITEKMSKLRENFEKVTLSDSKLVEHFKATNLNDRFSSIIVAGAILGGIEIRNFQRQNNNLDGEKEVFPYNAEQIKMIDKYNRLQETIDKIEEYAEQNFSEEDEREM